MPVLVYGDRVTPMWLEENRNQLTVVGPGVRGSLSVVNAVETPVDLFLLRILVLEDRLVNQAVIRRQLKQLNRSSHAARGEHEYSPPRS